MQARTDRLVALAILALAPAPAFAQANGWPTPSDIDRALKAHPMPSPQRLATPPVPRPPQIELRRPGIDLEALARSPGQPPLQATAPSPPALRIFVTLEMPRGSLERLTDQAQHSGALLVLRGLKAHSMRQTLDAVQSLIGDRPVTWTIDPEAFTRYGIHHAPTFLLTLAPASNTASNCGTQCTTQAPYVKVAGDVSTDYALEAIVRRYPQATAQASPLLQRLRSTR